MVKRIIIKIDEEKCTGCGMCVPGCPEGALQIVDGKARLVKEIFCDGLGACIGECPEGALELVEREADPFDEEAMKIHLKSLEEEHDSPHQEFSGCPGSRVLHWEEDKGSDAKPVETAPSRSELRQWPVQLMLVNPQAEYLQNADLAIIADCVPFAYADFHRDFLKGKAVVVGCPKLDDIGFYKEKLTQIFRLNTLKSVTVAVMEVPCCGGMTIAVQQALRDSGKEIPFETVVVGIKGEKKQESAVSC